MKRSPLKRKTRLVARRRRPRFGDDPAYLARVRTLPCRAADLATATPCRGIVHAHHAGTRPGIALKAHDHTALPICAQHHRDLHAFAGPFRLWKRAEMREWQDAEIAMVQEHLRLIPTTTAGTSSSRSTDRAGGRRP